MSTDEERSFFNLNQVDLEALDIVGYHREWPLEDAWELAERAQKRLSSTGNQINNIQSEYAGGEVPIERWAEHSSAQQQYTVLNRIIGRVVHGVGDEAETYVNGLSQAQIDDIFFNRKEPQ